MKKRIDVVYTWVDDSQPGYLEMLRQYAGAEIDLNPNRTRDNLELLKYSLRSLERYVDWRGAVYILSCRPQKPRWLKTDIQHLGVIHHDEFIDQRFLPTFNSFCIISHLARLKEVSDPFLYMEDDMLFASATTIDDFIADGQHTILRPQLSKSTNAGERHSQHQPPWDRALSYSNFLLDSRYGKASRHSINHVPVMIYKQSWLEMIDIWQDAFEHTRQSRFRELYNVAPEYLYQYFMLYENRAVMGNIRDTWRKTFYLGLDNSILLARAGLFLLDRINPRFYCLNDNFGEKADPRVEKFVRQYMESKYPGKSSFEA